MEYLENPQNIRNICILAHVDHGKTTIADSLIASNGIISHRMAGKLRYMDNKPEEQERGITMKSSSIALKYFPDKTDLGEQQRYLINLIDTPGHVDFCGEVSAAVRLCDGALIVIDVVEGVCPQTIASLEQSWKEGIEPILVFNKIDRLIVEQKMDEDEAYLRIEQLLEQTNAIVASLLTAEIFESDNAKQQDSQKEEQVEKQDGDGGAVVYDWASAIEDIDDDQFYFKPEKNNVVFASAIDDWAFTIDTFAKFLSRKYKINLSAFQKTLWGDYYIDAKQKRIFKGALNKGKKNLFTSMVLQNIWKMYDIVTISRDKSKIEKSCQVLEIELNPRDLNHNDTRHQIKIIMSKWLPLPKHVLECVSKLVPSPKNIKEKRVDRLLCTGLKKFDQLPRQTQKLKQSFLNCQSKDDSVKIICISKMLPYEKTSLPQFRTRISAPSAPSSSAEQTIQQSDTLTAAETNQSCSAVFIAFARVFSGRIKKGDRLFVLGPRHDPCSIQSDMTLEQALSGQEDIDKFEHISLATIEELFLLMGRDIESVDHADAGNIIGIRGLNKHLIRTGIVSSTIYCPPFHDWHVSITPILRVAIESKDPQQMPMLAAGLKLLNQADPCVEVELQPTGEHVIIATGELHLQHCIRDLKEIYTPSIELNVSQPVIPLRETIVLPRRVDMVNEAIGDNNIDMHGVKQSLRNKKPIEVLTPNKKCLISMTAFPMPECVQKYMADESAVLKAVHKITSTRILGDFTQLDESIIRKLNFFKEGLGGKFNEARKENSQWRHLYSENVCDKIWSFGPKYSGPNLLIASPSLSSTYNVWSKLFAQSSSRDNLVEAKKDELDLMQYIDYFIRGFQIATQSGPLCEEPMLGVCFVIHEWKYVDPSSNQDEEPSTYGDFYGAFKAQIMSTSKEVCRKAFQNQPQRLMIPMFSCDIQVTAEVLKKMYAVLGRRHGRVLDSDMREGSQIFDVKALIPVIESMDFVGEIRKQTSGLANPQLIFSHYELIDVDPFWKPSTEEEYALYGEKADTENQAKKYMNLVRRRKGLRVEEKIVEHGEKQRTVKKNK